MHQQSACSVKTPGKKKKKKERVFLDTVVSDHFSLWSKVGALALREVIFFFHIYPKSPGVLYGWSLKVGEMASRCTLMGISVAEMCGIEMTSADSYSLLPSRLLRASTEAICLGDTNTRRYGVDTVYALPAASSPLICPSAPLPSFYTDGDECAGGPEALHSMLDPKSHDTCMGWPRRPCGNISCYDHAEM